MKGRPGLGWVRNGLRLGTLLVLLTGINVYVFFFREDTALSAARYSGKTAEDIVTPGQAGQSAETRDMQMPAVAS